MTTKQNLPLLAESYIRATNDHDRTGFHSLFDDVAVVDDAGRIFRGRDAIRDWSNREIFDAQVTFEVLDTAALDGEFLITTRVDGNFDRTGLPDPVIIRHCLRVDGDKIVALTCRLVESHVESETA